MKKLIIGFTLFISALTTVSMANPGQSYKEPYSNSRKIQDGANDIINEIISVVGLKANFEVKAANIPNAAAITYQGTRYILYNPDFFNKLNKAAGDHWASISVLAHEIGHHLNGHTMENIGSKPENELEADEFSGFVLRRMGASLEQAQLALRVAADYKSSVTHPGKEARLIAIADGWQNAEAQITGKKDVAKNSARVETPVFTESAPVLSENHILGDVEFRADKEGSYFITKRMNLVKVANNQLYLVGKLSAINNESFPYMIYDDSKNLMLVDKRGNIFSESGKPVGALRVRK